MRLGKTTGTSGLLALAALASPFALAAEPGWYLGGNLGRSMATIDDAKISNSLSAAGFTSNTISDRNRSTGYKFYGGYQLNPNFALEASYFDLGKFGYTASTVPPGALNADIQLRGLALDALGMFPFSERFSVFGRLGLNYAQARDSFSGGGLVGIVNPSPGKNQINYKFGAGLMFALSETLALRLEGERYRVNDAIGNKGKVDLLSLGLVYRFAP